MMQYIIDYKFPGERDQWALASTPDALFDQYIDLRKLNKD